MKYIAAVLLLFSASLVNAQSDNWLYVGGTTINGVKSEYHFLKGSFEVITNKSGEEIALVVGREQDLSTRKIELQKLYVRTSDCVRTVGKAVVLNMDGEFKYDYDFAFGAGSYGSAKAELICQVWRASVSDKAGKGI